MGMFILSILYGCGGAFTLAFARQRLEGHTDAVDHLFLIAAWPFFLSMLLGDLVGEDFNHNDRSRR